MKDLSALEKYMRPGARCHMIGIGGVSMSPLAEVLHSMGITVTGSDMHRSAVTDHLCSLGIDVKIGHSPDNVAGADFVVRTAAAREDNVEVMAVRSSGIPLFERADAWGLIMRTYKNAIGVSGTHGKTTTTSMCTHIFMAADADPTVMIGGTLPLLHSGYRVGRGDTIIMESCEYYDSFLSFSPTVSVILDVEADHLDYFKDLDDVKKSFLEFARLVPEDTGVVIANLDDANTMDVVSRCGRRVVTFGLSDGADVRAEDIVFDGAHTRFTLIYEGRMAAYIALNVPGLHNVKNALAASASALVLGIGGEDIARGLATFNGAARRFEYKGKYNGVPVYDDYAHHPGELRALIDAVSAMGYRRVLLSFQPHTYSRTKALLEDFAAELRRPDKVFLAEIYAAREENVYNISSADLAAKIPGAVCCSSFEALEDALAAEARPGDIILTVGAGDIYRAGEALVARK